MISQTSCSPEHLKSIKSNKEFEKINPSNLEKMIYGFVLLENIKLAGLDLIFKGGTCLALHFDKPKRFSVDIDILTVSERKEIEDILNAIVSNSNFNRWGLYEKRSYKENEIPKAHYFLAYDSSIDNKENYILLDILFGKSFYPKTIELEINNSFIVNDGVSTKIMVPTINSIIGDKLTAFAPNTSGYNYNKGLELQMIKQLFDLSFLFEEITDFREVYDSFYAKIDTLNTYPNTRWSPENILEDVYTTSYILSTGGAGLTAAEQYKYAELETGVNRISDFLIHRPFRKEHAIEAASKLALLCAKIKKQNFDVVEEFDYVTGNVKYLIANQKYTALNKLKNQTTRSLFYWNQTISLIDQ